MPSRESEHVLAELGSRQQADGVAVESPSAVRRASSAPAGRLHPGDGDERADRGRSRAPTRARATDRRRSQRRRAVPVAHPAR